MRRRGSDDGLEILEQAADVMLVLAIFSALVLCAAVLLTNGDREEEQNAAVFETTASIADSALHDDPVPGADGSGRVDPTWISPELFEKLNTEPVPETEPDLDSMDVWALASYLYGIDELTTTRMLKLITIENYPEDWTLDYYCACACLTRAIYPEDFGGSDIYERFGENDTWYGAWMDEAYGIADHAYGALRAALLDFTYVNQCNGMAEPWDYIYYSEIYGIYVWNP